MVYRCLVCIESLEGIRPVIWLMYHLFSSIFPYEYGMFWYSISNFPENMYVCLNIPEHLLLTLFYSIRVFFWKEVYIQVLDGSTFYRLINVTFEKHSYFVKYVVWFIFAKLSMEFHWNLETKMKNVNSFFFTFLYSETFVVKLTQPLY